MAPAASLSCCCNSWCCCCCAAGSAIGARWRIVVRFLPNCSDVWLLSESDSSSNSSSSSTGLAFVSGAALEAMALAGASRVSCTLFRSSGPENLRRTLLTSGLYFLTLSSQLRPRQCRCDDGWLLQPSLEEVSSMPSLAAPVAF